MGVNCADIQGRMEFREGVLGDIRTRSILPWQTHPEIAAAVIGLGGMVEDTRVFRDDLEGRCRLGSSVMNKGSEFPDSCILNGILEDCGIGLGRDRNRSQALGLAQAFVVKDFHMHVCVLLCLCFVVFFVVFAGMILVI